MAFLCPNRRKKKCKDHAPVVGRITGSDSIDTIDRVGLAKELSLQHKQLMVVTSDFQQRIKEELEVFKGETVQLLYQEYDWFYVIRKNGGEGFIPANICQFIDNEDHNASHPVNLKHIINRSTPGRKVPENTKPHSKFSHVANKNEIHRITGANKTTGNETHERGNEHGRKLHEKMNTKKPFKTSTKQSRDVQSCVPQIYQSDVVDHGEILMIYDSDESRDTQNVKCNEINSKPTKTTFNKKNIARLRVLYDYRAVQEDDVNVHQGEIVTLLNKEDPDWFWVKTTTGAEGFVPSSYTIVLGSKVEKKGTRDNIQLKSLAERKDMENQKRTTDYRSNQVTMRNGKETHSVVRLSTSDYHMTSYYNIAYDAQSQGRVESHDLISSNVHQSQGRNESRVQRQGKDSSAAHSHKRTTKAFKTKLQEAPVDDNSLL